MNPDRLKEAILSLFSVFANQGTGYLPDQIAMPSSFAPIESPFQFEFNSQGFTVSMVKKDMWKTVYNIKPIIPLPTRPIKHLLSKTTPTAKAIHAPTFKALFHSKAQAQGMTPTEYSRTLGLPNLSYLPPLYSSKEICLSTKTDLFVEALGTDCFLRPEHDPKPKAKHLPKAQGPRPPSGLIPRKGQLLPIDRAEFQRLTGYPGLSKTEIAHWLGFKSPAHINKLFDTKQQPFFTHYAQYLADLLGESVLWAIRKTA